MAFFAPDIGIDLGSSNTMVYVRGRGIVISEPTLVATNTANRRQVRAVGDEAVYLRGRTSASLEVVQPIVAGAIADFDMTEVLIRYFIRKAIGVSHVFKPKVVIAVPCTLSAVARKAVEEAAEVAGAKSVYLVDKPFAAAIGSGLPVYEPVGSMVVDIGGGTTDAAIVSLGGLVVAQSIPVGGIRMDDAVRNHIRMEANLIISPQTAENVKKDLGAAMLMNGNRKVRIRGKDTVGSKDSAESGSGMGSAKDISYSAAQCYEALKEPCAAILAAIKWVLERTPPELAADIMRSGIHLTGGASQLVALDRYIATELGIPVLLAKEPSDCTVRGLGYLVENMQLLSSISRAGNAR